MATWNVQVKKIYVASGKVNKKGNDVLIPVIHRKLYLKDAKAFMDSGEYRVVAKKGKFTISVIPRIPQSCWTNPTGQIAIWYTLAPNELDDEGNIIRPYRRTDDKAMDETQILRWLTFRMGESEAKRALNELLTAMPEQAMAA